MIEESLFFWRFPSGPERAAVKAKYFAQFKDWTAANAPDADGVQRVTCGQRKAYRGPAGTYEYGATGQHGRGEAHSLAMGQPPRRRKPTTPTKENK